jgi:hypothetical protein
MKLLLDVKDSRAEKFLTMLHGLDYVQVRQLTPAHARFLSELKEAVDELNLVKAGKKKARSLDEFLHEL